MATPASSSESVRLVLITGLLGSGKSTVANCFEDLDFYCVDNLPLPLLREFVDDPHRILGARRAIAVVTDVRTPGFAEEFPRVMERIDRDRVHSTLLFLEASDETLVRRFSETRRSHPLAGKRPAIEGIREERALLADLRAGADMVLDSSEWSVHEIRDEIFREFSLADQVQGVVVSLISFGFKNGVPKGTDLLFDVRFLPNPHFEPGLRELTGRDAPVTDFLAEHEDYGELVRRVEDFLLYLLPRYERENRSYLTVAIGCTGGRHRSVAVSEELARLLSAGGWNARLIHRDLDR